MQQRRGEHGVGAVEVDVRVDAPLLVASLVPLEQAHLIVGVVAAVVDRFAEHMVEPWNAVAGHARGRGQHRLDLAAQDRRHALVRVHDQHPLVLEQRESPIFLCSGVHVLVLHDAVGIAPRDLQGGVEAERIADEDLVGPGHALQALLDHVRTVERGNEDREGRTRDHPSCLGLRSGVSRGHRRHAAAPASTGAGSLRGAVA